MATHIERSGESNLHIFPYNRHNESSAGVREHIRVVVVYVDTMSHGLLQGEEVNRLPLQNVCSGCKELVETPTLLLVGLHYTSEHWNQQHFQAPAGRRKEGIKAERRCLTWFQGPTYCDSWQLWGRL